MAAKARCDLSLKIGIVGDPGVGKTTLVQGQKTRGSGAGKDDAVGSADAATTTIGGCGIHVRVKLFNVGGDVYRVEFWDCPGAHRLMPLIPHYCSGCAGIIFVYDVTNEASFRHMRRWLKILGFKPSSNGASDARVARGPVADASTPRPLLLVANKVGAAGASSARVAPVTLEERRAVSKAEGELLAASYGMEYMEADGLEGFHVDKVFGRATELVARSVPAPPDASLLLKSGVGLGTLKCESAAFKKALYGIEASGDPHASDAQ